MEVRGESAAPIHVHNFKQHSPLTFLLYIVMEFRCNIWCKCVTNAFLTTVFRKWKGCCESKDTTFLVHGATDGACCAITSFTISRSQTHLS